MTNKEAYDILRQYNRWRRDPHTPNSVPMSAPKDIGAAIDTACDYLENTLKIGKEAAR